MNFILKLRKDIKFFFKDMNRVTKYVRKSKGVFKSPVKRYYLGTIQHGTPYFYPRNFNPNIISFRKLIETPQEELDKLPNDFQRKGKKYKNLPMIRRSKSWIFKLFNNTYWLEIGFPIYIYWYGLGWKDKWETPRHEWNPSFQVYFFHWQFCMWWVAPTEDNDLYWEMILWWSEYCGKNIKVAEDSWGWTDGETKLSTWDNNNLL